MCDRSAAQKVHRGNIQGCRRIFNEIKNYLIIFFSNCSKWLSTLVSLSRQSLSLWKYSWPYLFQSWCLKHPPGPSQCSGDQCSQCTLPVPQWAEDVMRWWPQVGHVAGDMLVFSLNIKNLINTLILCCCVRMNIITFICHNLAATRWQGDTILPPPVSGNVFVWCKKLIESLWTQLVRSNRKTRKIHFYVSASLIPDLSPVPKTGYVSNKTKTSSNSGSN